jgi:hypothetical protein
MKNLSVVRSYESNKHVQIIKRAQDSDSFEHEGANQDDDVLTDR